MESMENMNNMMDTPQMTNGEPDKGTGIPMPWPEHHHGVPMLETNLTPDQRLYWEAYNTTTYFTIDTPYKSSLHVHLFTVILSGIFLYPFVLVLNNLKSKKYIFLLYIQAFITFISCISYATFINNVPDLYPGMAYSKMITGLAIFTLIQVTFSTLNVIKCYLNPQAAWAPLKTIDDHELDDFSPSSPSTLFDHDENDGDSDAFSDFNLNSSSLSSKLSKLQPFITKLSPIITILHNVSTWGLFFYFMILFPTMLADLSLFGQGNRVFNLLAHWIKGGIFFLLGVLSLARYCGCFEGIGGAWNQTSITYNTTQVSTSVFVKLHRIIPTDGILLSFEFFESLLIFIYGSTNIFLEHLANPGGEWAAKDLQHASIAFMYLGAGLCGLIAEFKLSSWKKSLYKTASSASTDAAPNLITPGFSPNPFPIFTIFWTGLLMSKHAQASTLSTEIHVQWGSLLSYGTFFRLITFIIMSYPAFQSKKPTKPLTELITSFCLLAGGLIFMESTDQVIEALAYRGLTPMFTMNVSVGIVALIMAWIMTVFAVKDKLKSMH